ncbi:MAG: hypothetical protein IKZ65_02005 [Lachnospiraceae bacterium]|nr:hypothetical protein [Lachnospiraceae bacterium]
MKNNRTNNKAAKVIATIIATIVATTSISTPVFANGLEEAKEAVAAAATSVETIETSVDASVNDGGAIASESVEAFVEEIENITSSETISEAASEIQTVENEINAAAEADKDADDKANEAVANISSAAEVASQAVETAAQTKAQANDLVSLIKNSGSTSDQVNEALDKLDTITNNAANDIETKKEVIAVITSKFEEAKKELEKAEAAYENTVKTLKAEDGSAKKAAEKLEEAKKDVEALESAYNKAVSALKKEEALVEDIKDTKANSDKEKDWVSQNKLMKSIMTGYIIPNMMDDGATSISYSTSTQRGFDRQDSSYCVVTYTDKNGKVVNRYFNIDRTDRRVSETNQWFKIGNSREIIIYEKPEEDIIASKYQISHFGDLGKKGVNQEFKDGVYYSNGIAARKIVQTNSANATGIRVSTKDDEGLLAYIENASKLVEKYEAYSETIADTKEKINEASDKVEALESVISVIEEKKSRIANLAEGLKGFLSEEDLAKVLAAGSDEKAMEILEGILNNAKTDLEKASADLEELITKREELRKEINEKSKVEVIPAVEMSADSDDEEVEDIIEEVIVPAQAAPMAANNVVRANAAAYGNYSDSNNEEVFVSDVTLFANENANVIANTVSNAAANATTTSQNASTDDIAGALSSWWAVFQLAVLEILRVISPLFA